LKRDTHRSKGREAGLGALEPELERACMCTCAGCAHVMNSRPGAVHNSTNALCSSWHTHPWRHYIRQDQGANCSRQSGSTKEAGTQNTSLRNQKAKPDTKAHRRQTTTGATNANRSTAKNHLRPEIQAHLYLEKVSSESKLKCLAQVACMYTEGML
jgi:hypothetical protein